jgi:uncharacterized membrane protein
MTAPAVVCWAAHVGWLHFAGTKLAFIGQPVTLVIFTLLALMEVIVDKLPKAPARTAPLGLSARIVFGALCDQPSVRIFHAPILMEASGFGKRWEDVAARLAINCHFTH